MDTCWCQKMFRQGTDAARAFDCEREANHPGNCDSRLAQTVRKAHYEQKWEVNLVSALEGANA